MGGGGDDTWGFDEAAGATPAASPATSAPGDLSPSGIPLQNYGWFETKEKAADPGLMKFAGIDPDKARVIVLGVGPASSPPTQPVPGLGPVPPLGTLPD